MPEPNKEAPLPLRVVPVTLGQIAYPDRSGNKQIFRFQANPTSLTRSRSISLNKSPVGEAHATRTKTGQAGRKYTLTADNWKMEGIEINLDAAANDWTGRQTLPEIGLEQIAEALHHLEALAEPGPLITETDHRKSYPPQPSPPLAELTLGHRVWQGYVTSVRIEEKQFTHLLVPTRIKATLSFEVIVTVQDLDLNKVGGEKNANP